MPIRKYSFNEVASSLSPGKKKQDGTVTRFFHRPLSFPLAFFFLNTGFSPNGVTYLSIIVCLGGFIATLIPSLTSHIIAVALFTLFGTLDCVDGDMARTIKMRRETERPSGDSQGIEAISYGEWVDALGGYFAYTSMILGLGLSCMLVAADRLPGTDLFIPGGSVTWMVLSAICCSANLLMRLVFQSWRVVSGDKSKASVNSEKRFSEEIGITGWFQPVYLAGLLSGFLPWVLLVYSIVYCGGCLVTVLKLIIKVERESN